MRFCVSLLSLSIFVLAGCGQRQELDYTFAIKNVTVRPAYQSLDVRLQQELGLSSQAREALEHGVTLTIRLEMELRNDNNMIVARRDARRFQLRYLPLSERYQFSEEETGELKAFSRLRHMLAALDDFTIQLSTGPLPSGSYELRTRISLDESRLPTPMQLPAWFSSQWRHDSEWSVWPFIVSV
ncbi:MAG: DUF4390 domain-containing protein [Lysobacterales bacterium]|jgi:hypothetical protein